ncbi:MAG: DnaD domain protein [Bacilli bacterium]
MEYEIINGWLDVPFKEELIISALKEATYNGVSNLRYIDKILYEWKKKGINSKEDIEKNRNDFQNRKVESKPLFDYDWLNDNE